MEPRITSRYKNTWLIAGALALFAAVLYLKTVGNGFIDLDDQSNLFDNPLVRHIRLGRIFGTIDLDYIPLVYLSFAVEHAFVGFAPWLYHLDNVVLHALNSALVFLFFLELAPEYFFAAVTAAVLFAVHPLHVESVAWVTERKDVLSTFFALLSLIAYSRYTKSGAKKLLAASSVFFLLAMFSKFMVVTLPALLFLCDLKSNRKVTGKTVAEKTPFFVIAAIFTFVMFNFNPVTSGTHRAEAPAFGERMHDALNSLTFYVTRSLVPVDLSVYYERGAVDIPVWLTVLTIVLLSAALYIVFRRGFKNEAFFGFAFFAVTFVPVSRIIPFSGDWVFADRYFYLPSVGLFYFNSFVVFSLIVKLNSNAARVATACLAIVPVAYAGAAFQREGAWKDAATLWQDALKKYPSTSRAHFSLGWIAEKQGDNQTALKEYTEAVNLNPKSYQAFYNIGHLYEILGNPAMAKQNYMKAIEAFPYHDSAYINWGVILAGEKDFAGAADKFKKAMEANPKSAVAHYNLAQILAQEGAPDKAVEEYKTAIALNPDYFEAHFNLGVVYSVQNKLDDAEREYKAAIELKPDLAPAHQNLGMIYQLKGRANDAAAEFAKARSP